MTSEAFEQQRRDLVRHSVAARGIVDARVLEAMSSVRREQFVPPESRGLAYYDRPLPIEAGQTISQPFIVALMAEAAAVEPTDRVLEVGAGSGYGAAVLGCLAREVWTIERHPELVALARQHLESEGMTNVHVIEGDGTLGWPDAGPYDAIVVTAGGPRVPVALLAQLAQGGRLVMPVGDERKGQDLVRVTRQGDKFIEDELGAVRFVPLIGEQGWRQ